MEIIHIEVKLNELWKEVNEQEKQKARNGVLGNSKESGYIFFSVSTEGPWGYDYTLPRLYHYHLAQRHLAYNRDSIHIFRAHKSQGWENYTVAKME